MRTLLKEMQAWRRRRIVQQGQAAKALDAVLKTKAVFVHIPKCGGKSIIKDIYGLDLHDHFGHANTRYYQSLLGPRRFAAFHSFALLRDPIERAVSGFNFLKAGGFRADDGPRRFDTDIENFDQFVSQGHLKDRSLNNVVFYPQSRFLKDMDGTLAVDTLYDFAKFDDAVQDIRAKCGLPATKAASKINVNRGQKSSEFADETLQIVQDVYQEDYANFGAKFGWTKTST